MINELMNVFLWVAILFAILLIAITERIYGAIKEKNELLREQNKLLKGKDSFWLCAVLTSAYRSILLAFVRTDSGNGTLRNIELINKNSKNGKHKKRTKKICRMV